MEITEWLGHGLIYFFTEIPLIGDAMAAFLAIVLIGTAFAIAYRYKQEYHAPLALAIEARVRLLDEITGGSTADVDEARLEFARRFAKTCEAMKADGIEIYTIAFALNNDTEGNNTREMFRTCASDRNTHFFSAATGADLNNAFVTIAAELIRLRLAQ